VGTVKTPVLGSLTNKEGIAAFKHFWRNVKPSLSFQARESAH